MVLSAQGFYWSHSQREMTRGFCTPVLYAAENVLGSLLAAAASLMIGFVPFVVLELCWFIVAVTVLAKVLGGRPITPERQ